jgi:hypothetical protein
VPTEAEIKAAAEAIRSRYEDSRIKLTKWPTDEELARLALEAAEKARKPIPFP